MKIQLISDLHLEFQHYPFIDAEADVVVLAGDINIKKRGLTWIRENVTNKPVIYVMGNHEYYSSAYPKMVNELKDETRDCEVYVLENDMITIDGINFLGCTLWTNFELFGDPKITGYLCQQRMNDFKKIRVSPKYSKLRSVDVAVIHKCSINWLQTTLEERRDDTNIIVTHHAPSKMSISTDRHDDYLTASYVSNLEGFISKYQPAFWLHGHIHRSSKYTVGKTSVLANPKGYPGEENKSFDPEFCFFV